MAGKLIARWETKGKKYWYDLYHEKWKGKDTHYYKTTNGGGEIGYSTKSEAIANIQARVRSSDKNYKRVK